MSSREFLAAVLLPFLFCPAVSAQETRPENYRLRQEVSLVRVEALVLEKGKPRRGLKKEDFVIREDGVEQEIERFRDEPVPSSLVIVVDQSGSLENFFAEEKEAARLVLGVLSPEDEVAIVGFDQEIRISTEFTTDRGKTIATLAGLRNEKGWTNLIRAVEHGIDKLRNVPLPRRRILLLLSDNVHEIRGIIRDKIPPATNARIRSGVIREEIALYSIKVGKEVPAADPTTVLPGSGENLIRELVKTTGGQIIVHAKDKKPLIEALRLVVERLKNTYSLFYIPADLQKTGLRKTEVKLKENPRVPPFFLYRKYKVISHKEYYLRKTTGRPQ